MIAKTPFLMTQVNEIGNRLDKSRPGGGVGSRKKKESYIHVVICLVHKNMDLIAM
jgi:hypothetical protein